MNETNQMNQSNQTNQNNQPVLVLRDNTERPETITIGTNELISTDPSKLPSALARLMAGQWGKKRDPSEMGRQGGRADRRES